MMDDKPKDLPDDHFIRLDGSQYQSIKREHWSKVKDLADNNPHKVLYFRRFTEEFVSPSGFVNPHLRRLTPNFDHYIINSRRKDEIPAVEQKKTSLILPSGKKLGIVIGYHHLEKPWGTLFREMFERQVEYDPTQVSFILIENGNIPTGDRSNVSDEEIRKAIQDRGLTHIIDVHEQLSTLNHYMGNSIGTPFDDKFRYEKNSRKNPNGGEYTLDPFVPLWCIEQYFKGNVYPQLQYAVNDQINDIGVLVKNIEKK